MSGQATGQAQAQRRKRRQGLALVAVLALLAHLALLGGVEALSFGSDVPPGASSVAVRTIEAAPVESVVTADPPALAPAPTPAPASARPRVRVPRAAREPAQTGVDPQPTAIASAEEAASAAAGADAASAPASAAVAAIALAPPPHEPASATAVALPASTAASAPASPLAAGEAPPPTYRPLLPPAVNLVYEVRRGFLRGTGEIRWQPQGDSYSLTLQARIAGLTLLTQTSQGAIDGSGLAPERFVDQRARRAAQAANFRRDSATITYSGPQTQWVLLAGSQDRISWMVQLAGIAAAEPQLLSEGGHVSMIVVGARGDASLWVLRYAGQETVQTAAGAVHAVKLVRDGHSVSDSSAEIWLDPANHYLPAHATLRNSAGESEYDLLLERSEAGS